MPTLRLRIPGVECELDARLDLPSAEAKTYALFAHCFTCSKDSVAASRISRSLAAKGVAVLRFDFTGLGGSDGDFANTNFSSNVQDLIQAADYLRQHHRAPSILIGHSLGGAAVLAAAPNVIECKAVATIGAPSDPSHVQHLFSEDIEEIKAEGKLEVTLAGRKFVIRKQFLDDIETQTLREKIHDLRRALLVMHSPQDDTVGIDEAAKIYKAARHPKSFISLDGADHLVSNKVDAEYVAQVLTAWVSRYLPNGQETGGDQERVRGVLVSEAGTGKFVQDITIGPHRLLADEPVSVGGSDSGPTPYDYLLTALGSCTSMTMRLYAERKRLPLKHVEVTLRHDKIHAEDCDECESESGRIDRIRRDILIDGNLDAEQRQRLLEIADKCPVHKTLHSEVLVETNEQIRK